MEEWKIISEINIFIHMVMGYALDSQGSIPGRSESFSLLQSVQAGSGPHLASYPMCTGGALSLGVKQPQRECGHPPLFSAETAPPYVFMVWCLVKHRDSFTATFTLWNMIPVVWLGLLW
jgi:hypothetical protein